jgi:hypothetical protein
MGCSEGVGCNKGQQGDKVMVIDPCCGENASKDSARGSTMQLDDRGEVVVATAQGTEPGIVETLPHDHQPGSSVSAQGGSVFPAGTRLQVLLDTGWVDASAGDLEQVFKSFSNGLLQFGLQAGDAVYAMDFSREASATQTNRDTGKVRKLRMLDASGDEISLQEIRLRGGSISEIQKCPQPTAAAESFLASSGKPDDDKASAPQACPKKKPVSAKSKGKTKSTGTVAVEAFQRPSGGDSTPKNEPSVEKADTPLSAPGARLQVELDGKWVDAGPDEVSQIRTQLEAGVTKFTAKMRGVLYVVDFSSAAEGTQTNTKTNTRRRLRII